MFCEVGHETRDSEVFARVGRLGVAGVLPDQTTERLDLGLFLAVADFGAHQALYREVPYACAVDERQMQRVLSHFASGLRRYGAGLLAGDSETYTAARKLTFLDVPMFRDEHESGAATPTANSSDEQTTFAL